MKHRYIDHIFSLLHEEECVIIPDFGGFLAQYRSAYLDQGVIYPPGRKISFNRKLQNNDGLLANFISQKENCTYNEALGSIGLMVKEFEGVLQEGKPLILKDIGTLILDEHQNLQFHPLHTSTLSHASYGLESVILPPLVITEKEIVKAKEIPLRKEPMNVPLARKVYTHHSENKVTPVIALPREPNKKRNYWMAAALVPFVLYLGVVLYQSNVLCDGKFSTADLNPFKALQKSPYTQRSAELTDSDIWQEDVELNLTDKIEVKTAPIESDKASESKIEAIETKVGIEEAEAVPEAIVKTEKAPEEADILELPVHADASVANRPYHVIAGCFGVYSNAEGMVNKLRNKGYRSFIIDERKGLNRVCYESFEQKESALTLLDKVKREEDAGAWLLHK